MEWSSRLDLISGTYQLNALRTRNYTHNLEINFKNLYGQLMILVTAPTTYLLKTVAMEATSEAGLKPTFPVTAMITCLTKIVAMKATSEGATKHVLPVGLCTLVTSSKYAK
jgi:hypothetical protein